MENGCVRTLWGLEAIASFPLAASRNNRHYPGLLESVTAELMNTTGTESTSALGRESGVGQLDILQLAYT